MIIKLYDGFNLRNIKLKTFIDFIVHIVNFVYPNKNNDDSDVKIVKNLNESIIVYDLDKKSYR